MTRREWMVMLAVVTVGIILRFVPHAPNFSPALGVVMFAAAAFSDKRAAIVLPLILLFFSDLLIGLYDGISFVYLGYVIGAGFGLLIRKQRLVPTVAASLLASTLFFVISNLGVWLCSGIYPRTVAGLEDCFIMAIPFFHNTVISTVATAMVLSLAWRFAAHRVLART